MVIVEIKSGKIRGKKSLDIENKQFYSFQNIPYAEPPLGTLRFKAPKPVKPWPGIKDATKEGNECLSRHVLTRKILGSEDCLNLNVYTPELHSKPKPVIFWIHGGIFITGSNKTEFYGPEFLMTEDVVVVTINYRLGLLGFLSLDDPSLGVPGNAGLKDMVLALKWVQLNIAHFCGDPNNVTVCGQSAGAAAAHLLMLSPMGKGLFHRVIMQSACAFNEWVPGRRSARLVAKELGYQNTDDRKLLQFLQEVPAKKLLVAQIVVDSQDFMQYDIRILGPVVEKIGPEEAFLSESPRDIIRSGNYNHVPMMVGYCEREGMAIDGLLPAGSKNSFFENLELSVPFSLKVQKGSAVSMAIADLIRHFYYNGVRRNRQEHLVNYFDMVTDTTFVRDIYMAIKFHIESAKQPIYFYKFALQTNLNLFKNLAGITVPGVYHSDDICYLFKTALTPEIQKGSDEDISRRKMTRLWCNFARFGNPTPNSSDILNVQWSPLTRQQFFYLEIGKELVMKINPEPARMAFWENVFDVNPAVSKL